MPRNPQSPRFYRRRSLWVTLGVIALVIIGAGALFGYQASKVSDSLNAAADDASALQSQITGGDQAAARTSLDSLRKHTEAARNGSNGFLWKIASGTPIAGKNVKAVRTVSRVLDDLADKGLPPIVGAADAIDLKTFSPKNGRIDVEALARLAPSVEKANTVLTQGNKELDEVDADKLFGRLKSPVTDLKAKVAKAQSAASDASTALQVLPTMLGGTQKRTYALIVQNNAEIRATGGLPGAWAVVTAEKGKIALGQQGAGADLVREEPFVPLTEEELDLYSPNLSADFRDINFTADFPRTAVLGKAILKELRGIDVSGMLSVDPVALSYILKGTGPVKLADGTTLTSDNAVDVLLNQVYTDYPDPRAQDAVFASAASTIFNAVASGAGNPQGVIKGLARGAKERRLLVWSQGKAEQAVLAKTVVGGAWPTEESSTPYVNLTLNDATGAKMEYYLDFASDVTARDCTKDGVQTLVATIKLRSDAPTDAKLLPKAIIGPGFGAPPGSMLMNLRAFAPVGGKITGATINGEETDLFPGSERGRPATTITALLEPGDSQVLAVTMKTAPGQTGDVKVAVTPGLKHGGNAPTVASSCS